MRVIHLGDEGENYVESAGESFLVLRAADGRCHAVSATCPHRGGPLHLGRVEEGGQFIVCPWHKTRVSIARLLRGGLPTVSNRGRVSVVVPGDEADAATHAYRRTTLVDCEAALAGGVSTE